MADFLRKMRDVIREKWVPDFEYAVNDVANIPWAKLNNDLSQCKLAVISTGGFHYDHKYVNEDLNVALPLEIFRQFERESLIRELAETNYSFMGYIPVTGELINTTAPEVAERLAAARVEAVFLAPT